MVVGRFRGARRANEATPTALGLTAGYCSLAETLTQQCASEPLKGPWGPKRVVTGVVLVRLGFFFFYFGLGRALYFSLLVFLLSIFFC